MRLPAKAKGQALPSWGAPAFFRPLMKPLSDRHNSLRYVGRLRMQGAVTDFKGGKKRAGGFCLPLSFSNSRPFVILVTRT